MLDNSTPLPARVDRTCERCQMPFVAWRKDVLRGNGRFCSRDCFNRARSENHAPLTRVCAACAADFPCQPADRRRFCSSRCYGSSRRKAVVKKEAREPRQGAYKPCAVCGTMTYRKPSHVTARQYCSIACKNVGTRKPSSVVRLIDDGRSAMVEVYGKNGAVVANAIVETADIPLVGVYRWYLQDGYARANVKTGTTWDTVSMHRMILGLAKGDGIDADHLDRDKLNNRHSNLRPATRQTNAQNKSKRRGSKSSYRGVTLHNKTGKWQAAVTVSGKRHYLGLYATEEEAGAAAREARLRLMPFATD